MGKALVSLWCRAGKWEGSTWQLTKPSLQDEVKGFKKSPKAPLFCTVKTTVCPRVALASPAFPTLKGKVFAEDILSGRRNNIPAFASLWLWSELRHLTAK